MPLFSFIGFRSALLTAPMVEDAVLPCRAIARARNTKPLFRKENGALRG
jgi:hypothetical protein